MRTLIQHAPFRNTDTFWAERGRFPAEWITHPDAITRRTDDVGRPIVMAFRRRFTLDQPKAIRIHVTADERYELWLDGVRIGRGSERGDRLNWFFETYDLLLSPGDHLLVARVWWLGKSAPNAQITVKPAFLLCADDLKNRDLISTGFADWEVTELHGYTHTSRQMNVFAGDKVRVDGAAFPWNWQQGAGENYVKPLKIAPGYNDLQQTDQPKYEWILRPATLPPMLEEATTMGRVRHVESIAEIPSLPIAVDPANDLVSEALPWNEFLAGTGLITIPPHTFRRVIIDLNDYVCAYPELTLSGHGTVRTAWAEALYFPPEDGVIKGWWSFRRKGNRNEVDTMYFVGNGDEFISASNEPRTFDTLWWSAGRYVELVASAGDSALILHSFKLRQTHYPHHWLAKFDSSDARLAEVIPIAKRVMEMCSHETYMDCPYYEQLMYVGDTRLEVLVTYTQTPDDRLPRKAIDLFGRSRKSPGFTQARYPCNSQQIIPPFSAWWVAMVHDFAMWRGDLAFVRQMMPDVRGVMDAFMLCLNADGLIEAPLGWNFMDWVPTWQYGIPKDGDHGVSGLINAQLAWILKQAAELEFICGEPELAALQLRRATDLCAAIDKKFWSEERGLIADDLDHTAWSEHAQCMVLLAGLLPEAKLQRVATGLLQSPDLARCTVYFQHYLFETYRKLGRIDLLIDHMGLWFDLKAQGFKTVIEHPEPSRSDCHAWGAHPLFHYLATICGIRPTAPGLSRVEIRPQLGPLTWAKGSMPHPRGGEIAVDFKREGDRIIGTIELPHNVRGIFINDSRQQPLNDGLNTL
jgi:hypothetical protein